MICLQNKTKCAFYVDGGECDILRNTKFTRPCPFYKEYKNVLAETEFAGHNGRFREVRGYEGRYYVSEYGEVLTAKGNVLARKKDKEGYPVVSLRHLDGSDGRYSALRVSRLVADAFMPGEGRVYNIDGNVLNCELTNLIRGKDNAEN